MQSNNSTGASDCPPDKFDAIDPQKLAQKLDADRGVLNPKRHWVMDEFWVYAIGETRDFDGVKATWMGSMALAAFMPGAMGKPYTPFTTNRASKYLYQAGKPVYLLVPPGGRKIVYVMQSYTDHFEKSLTIDKLPELGTMLTLPPAWSFKMKVLDRGLTVAPPPPGYTAHSIVDNSPTFTRAVDSIAPATIRRSPRDTSFRERHMKQSMLGLAVVAALGLLAASVHAQQALQSPPAAAQAEPPPIEQKAHDILKAACKTLEAAKAMSFTAVSTYENAARNGQPLYYATLNQVTMQRPDKLRVITPGDGVPDEFYYNGKTIMAYVPSEDLVAVADAPPTVDQMIDVAWEKAAIYFPFADVLVSKPCALFEEEGINSAFYVGRSKVIGGTVTDMVAVAADNIQAELWIGVEDHLPRLVRVVYPHEPAHALYQTEYSDWHLVDSVDPAMFTSERATNGKPMKFAPPGLHEERPGAEAPPPQQQQ